MVSFIVLNTGKYEINMDKTKMSAKRMVDKKQKKKKGKR